MTETVGIICAMQSELDSYRAELTNFNVTERYGIVFYEGILSGVRTVLCVSGIGKVNAANVASILLQSFAVTELFSTGVAGGIGLKLLDIVIPNQCCQHDIDTTALGDPHGFISGGGFDCVYLPTDPNMVKIMLQLLPDAKTGTVATGDMFVASEEQAALINQRFGAIAVDCESCAIVQTAIRFGVPAAVLRAVSDGANAGGEMTYQQFVVVAAQKAKSAVMSYLAKKAEKESK